MISCSDYDHVEIVCMHKYPIKITLKSGEIIEGKALDTSYDADKQECIKLQVNNHTCLLVLESIYLLEVTINNPHFNKLTFN